MPVNASDDDYYRVNETLYISREPAWGWEYEEIYMLMNGVTSLIITYNGSGIFPDGLFSNQLQLISVTINAPNGSVGTSAFEGCSGITNLSLSEGTTINSFAFKGCSSLTSVEIKGGKIYEKAFYGCTSLETVTLKDTAELQIDWSDKYSQFGGCSNLTRIDITSTNMENTIELLEALQEMMSDSSVAPASLATINIEFPEGMSTEDKEAISTKFGECFGNEMNTNIDIIIPPTPDSDSNKEGKSSESSSKSKSATSTPATPAIPAEVTFMLDSMSRISKAKEGDTVIIDGRELGIHSYSLAFMKTIAENRKANTILKYRYKGVEFIVTIPAGAKITLNENIPWYGPLYIYSGALGKDVKINISAKK